MSQLYNLGQMIPVFEVVSYIRYKGPSNVGLIVRIHSYPV